MTLHPKSPKVAVITGASGGFGLITALELARAGFRVIATMRNLKKRLALDEAVALENLAAAIEVRHLDVTAFDTHTPFFDSVVGEFGSLDVLVNNAGFSMAGFAEDVSLAELREQNDEAERLLARSAREEDDAVIEAARSAWDGDDMSVRGRHGKLLLALSAVDRRCGSREFCDPAHAVEQE